MLFSSSECITWFAVLLIVSVAIVTVNLISIILFIKNRSLRTRAMYLVINLTIVDMFVGGFSYFYIFQHLYEVSVWLFEISILLVLWFSLTSLTNITVISLDRVHATIRPFRHRLIKKWVYVVTIAGVWVFPAMVSAALLTTLTLDYFTFILSYYFLCLFVICVSYSSIAVKFLCGAHPQHHGAANRQRKLTVTLFIMTIVSLLMWLPNSVYIFFVLFQSSIMKFLSPQESFRLNFSSVILCFMNSLVNPIVYTIRIPEFRKALLLLFKRQRRQNARDIPLHAL